MSDLKPVFEKFLAASAVGIPAHRTELFDAFISDEKNIHALKVMMEHQTFIMSSWILKNKVDDILHSQCIIPNGTVGKPYEARLDFEKLQWQEISFMEIEGLDGYGVSYDRATTTISGTPTRSGDLRLSFRFRVEGEPENAELHEKKVSLVINPDPKSLWKNIASKADDPYWKPDDVAESVALGDRQLVVASRRGRSHANVGGFREDDYAFKHYAATGWSLVVVADGAGSAKLSRKGSQMACQEVLNYFDANLGPNESAAFDKLLQTYTTDKTEEIEKYISDNVYNLLGKCALSVHKKLEAFADSVSAGITDLNSTLIFTLFKKYEFGYALMSFGVGDCPIGVLNKELTELKLMNWLDVGEFGGGTRFITTTEIFKSEKFSTRMGFRIVPDFGYLMLMTDGIYDPKFVVEANLEKLEKWKIFLSDLQGDNDDGVKVEFRADNADIQRQLLRWMEFWSPGNHDDRTLAIVF